MTSPNTKQAEKEYLARTGSSAWERSKPFSPPGLDTLAESARMLHDFAAALLVLEPAAGDRILDLGAGACWCSDLLSRLNRPAISVDISLDMLRAGRSRPGTSIRALSASVSRPGGENGFERSQAEEPVRARYSFSACLVFGDVTTAAKD